MVAALLQSKQPQGHQLGQLVVAAPHPEPTNLILAGQNPFQVEAAGTGQVTTQQINKLEKRGSGRVGGLGATASPPAVPGLFPVPEHVWPSGLAGGQLQLETERVPDPRQHQGQVGPRL